MIMCGAAAIVLFSMMVKRELQQVGATSLETEDRKEAPATLSTGLMRMRRGGASVDLGGHVRSFSRSISGFVRVP